jgi:hypothetical protein
MKRAATKRPRSNKVKCARSLCPNGSNSRDDGVTPEPDRGRPAAAREDVVERARFPLIGCMVSLALAWVSGNPAYAQSAPEKIEDAIAIVAKITDPDPHKQDELRTRAAFNMVTDRIKIINDVSGAVLQTIPVDFWNFFSSCGNIKARTEALDIARAKGWDIARASWIVRAGACDENASVMTEILTRAGVKNITILRSGSPHAFPVVGLAPDADPDIPWTWGPNAIVPDTWNGKFHPMPLDVEKIWEDSLYFNGGENFVLAYGRTTTRELLKQMAERGADYIKQRCDVYRPAMMKFMLIPEKYRNRMALKPPKLEDVCRRRTGPAARGTPTGAALSTTSDWRGRCSP